MAGGIGEELAVDQFVLDGGLSPEHGVELVVGRRVLLAAREGGGEQAEAGKEQVSHGLGLEERGGVVCTPV